MLRTTLELKKETRLWVVVKNLTLRCLGRACMVWAALRGKVARALALFGLGLHTLTAKAWVQPLIRAPRPHKLHGTANDHRGICLRCCPSGSPWGGHLGARPWYGMKNATGICPNGPGSSCH